jgi:hypothetical protein
MTILAKNFTEAFVECAVRTEREGKNVNSKKVNIMTLSANIMVVYTAHSTRFHHGYFPKLAL